jgi:hypothetical protein
VFLFGIRFVSISFPERSGAQSRAQSRAIQHRYRYPDLDLPRWGAAVHSTPGKQTLGTGARAASSSPHALLAASSGGHKARSWQNALAAPQSRFGCESTDSWRNVPQDPWPEQRSTPNRGGPTVCAIHGEAGVRWEPLGAAVGFPIVGFVLPSALSHVLRPPLQIGLVTWRGFAQFGATVRVSTRRRSLCPTDPSPTSRRAPQPVGTRLPRLSRRARQEPRWFGGPRH